MVNSVDCAGVAGGFGAISGMAIGIAGGGGLAVGHAEGGANLKFRVDGFDRAEGLALRDVDNVGGTHALGKILARGSMDAPGVTEKREDPRLVENAPVRDAVAQGAHGDVNVIGEARGE